MMQQSIHSITRTLALFSLEETQALVTSVLDSEADTERSAYVIWEMTAGWPLYAEQASILLLGNNVTHKLALLRSPNCTWALDLK